ETHVFTADELNSLDLVSAFYTSTNDWPTDKTYYAQGIALTDIMDESDVIDSSITFEGADGYSVTLTAQQLFASRYTFADDEPRAVEPILAYRMIEGDQDSDIGDAKLQTAPTLVFGQEVAGEHTNPAFVEDICRITVTNQVEQWEPATVVGATDDVLTIRTGETVKLMHDDFSKVKLHYTLDGSEPTLSSTMYNPSTYQPELNKPILIDDNATLRVLVVGFGKLASDPVTFEIKVEP
ncbi:MAG: chitobiase/beta-hexosaminidase C-terminal domain-containing protein, partial [Actinomycetia bacterium]|nr:chitobiase/beta-hexosaminidase C-terminal domain-containing protein [Actinomycetes bacterium]